MQWVWWKHTSTQKHTCFLRFHRKVEVVTDQDLQRKSKLFELFVQQSYFERHKFILIFSPLTNVYEWPTVADVCVCGRVCCVCVRVHLQFKYKLDTVDA